MKVPHTIDNEPERDACTQSRGQHTYSTIPSRERIWCTCTCGDQIKPSVQRTRTGRAKDTESRFPFVLGSYDDYIIRYPSNLSSTSIKLIRADATLVHTFSATTAPHIIVSRSPISLRSCSLSTLDGALHDTEPFRQIWILSSVFIRYLPIHIHTQLKQFWQFLSAPEWVRRIHIDTNQSLSIHQTTQLHMGSISCQFPPFNTNLSPTAMSTIHVP